MRILSFYFGHDANVTLLDEGEVVCVLEKERLTRVKHDAGPMDLEAILEEYGWSPDSVDLVVFNPYLRPGRTGNASLWRSRASATTSVPTTSRTAGAARPRGA